MREDGRMYLAIIYARFAIRQFGSGIFTKQYLRDTDVVLGRRDTLALYRVYQTILA